MRIECWCRTLKAYGYIDADCGIGESETALLKYIEIVGKLPVLDVDLESIDSAQSYMRLLGRISRFIGGELVLRRIKSSIDESDGMATVQFEWLDNPYTWRFAQTADWINGEFLEEAYAFVAEHTKGRLVPLPTSDPYLHLIFVPVEVGVALGRC